MINCVMLYLLINIKKLSMKIKESRVLSLTIITLIYSLSFITGYFSFYWMDNLYIKFFLMDVIATITVFIFSVIFKNTSVYDPYWSLTPWAILTYFFISFKAFSIYNIVIYIVFTIWSWRLTINWVITFPNLTHEDWRYSYYRNKLDTFKFQVVNFIGLHMIPTVLVYGGLLPLLVLFVNGNNSPLSLIGAFIILIGVILEFVTDHEMHSFLRSTKERITCRNGLWNYSRHPNYLGENIIWIGCFTAMVVVLPHFWWLFFGFVLMILLFEFISIPLAEKHHKSRRNDYVDYIKTTSRMLLLPHKKD